MRPLRPALLIVVALSLCACATQRSLELPVLEDHQVVIEGPDSRPTEGGDDILEVSGIWESYTGPFGHLEMVAAAQTPLQEVPVEEARPREPTALERLKMRASRRPKRPALRLPVPKLRGPERPLPADAETLAAEHFLRHPTRVVAGSITFYCPARLAAEVRLTGQDMLKTHATRRLARGNARLVLRELTLEAGRITLRTRDDPDVQVTARGNVSLVSKVADHVMREEGVRGVLITNDKVVPLR